MIGILKYLEDAILILKDIQTDDPKIGCRLFDAEVLIQKAYNFLNQKQDK